MRKEKRRRESKSPHPTHTPHHTYSIGTFPNVLMHPSLPVPTPPNTISKHPHFPLLNTQLSIIYS